MGIVLFCEWDAQSALSTSVKCHVAESTQRAQKRALAHGLAQPEFLLMQGNYMNDNIPESIRANHPEEVEALRAHREGRTSTAQCPQCGAIVSVRDVPGIRSFWIMCANGHTLAHFNLANLPPNDR